MLDYNQIEFLIEEMRELKKYKTSSKIITDRIKGDITYETVYNLLQSAPDMLVDICSDIIQFYDNSYPLRLDCFPNMNFNPVKAMKAEDIMDTIETELRKQRII